MNRWIVIMSVLVVGCGSAEGRVSYGTKKPSSEAPRPASPPPNIEETTTTAAPGVAASPAPAASAAPPPQAPQCPLVCNVAQRGRLAQADEARFASALANQTQALRNCMRGPSPGMILRFDSKGALTYFGVEPEGSNDRQSEEEGEGIEGGCIDSVRHQLPSVTFAGPSTVRCIERCR